MPGVKAEQSKSPENDPVPGSPLDRELPHPGDAFDLQRVRSNRPGGMLPGTVLALQRALGNRAVAGLLQAKHVARFARENKSHTGGPQRGTTATPHNGAGAIQPKTAATARPAFQYNFAAGSSAVQVIQRSNTADRRLPLDKTEALSFATAANTEIQNAVTHLGTSSDSARKNIPAYVSAQKLKLGPLTPRHDSTVAAPAIRFFPGYRNYSGSFSRAASVRYYVSPNRKNIYIRARDHTNVDNLLPAAEIENRVLQAITEISHSVASTHTATPTTFEVYRGKFNGYWSVPPFNTQHTEWNPNLTSRGPQSTRARNIFERIYQEDPAFATAYDNNTGGIRERVNTYMGPEGRNPLNSPRVQSLRAKFHPYPTPITSTARYNKLKADIQSAAAALQPEERQAISDSNDWRTLIAIHCTTQARRDEIRDIITTQPSAPPSVAPAPAPAPSAPVSGSGAQAFLDGVTIDGPTTPITANDRTEFVTLTPKSPVPNPGVSVDTRFTVTPANRVKGSNVSPASPWPATKKTGTPHDVEIWNTGNVTMTAKLDLINNPAGLKPATAPTLNFTVNDNRKAHLVANWEPFLNYTKEGSFAYYDIGAPPTVRYVSGTQRFIAMAQLTGGYTNPGISVYMRIGVYRGANKLSERIDAFPHDQDATPEFRTGVSAPTPMPPAGDTLTFKFDLLEQDRTTVINTKTVAMLIKPELTYKQSDALKAAKADQAWMNGTAPGQLLDLLTKKGGQYAKLSSAIRPPNPLLTVTSFIVRHDSAAYVAMAGKPATQMAYFEGTTYGPYPDPNTLIDQPGRPAYALPYKLYLNKTTDVATGATRPVADIIESAIHEGTHTVDQWLLRTPIEEYKSEFRAYWNEGRFGPPNKQLCLGMPGCFDTTYDPSMSPPGPKSPRAREIFNHLYASYPFVKPAYDANTDGFRDKVDTYLHPEGLNLIFSRGLDALQKLVRTYTPGNFASLHTQVKGFMGIGAAPPTGALTATDKTEIVNNRAWGNLLDDEVSNAAHRNALRGTLKIP